MSKIKVAVLGCGNIGSVIAKALVNNECPGKELSVICDLVKTTKIHELLNLSGAVFVQDADRLPELGPDVVVEASHPEVAVKYTIPLVEAGINLILLSSGALLDRDYFNLLTRAARQTQARIIVPSGAIGGLSVLRAVRNNGQLEQVVLTTTKHPRSLAGAPFFSNEERELEELTEKTLIFEGNAGEAIQGFPQNVNVAATVSLAGLGPEKTLIRIFADPQVTRTTHRLEAMGGFGKLTLELENVISPENPRSSYLATLSAIAALQDFDGSLVVGW